jgi:hypothetical protein
MRYLRRVFSIFIFISLLVCCKNENKSEQIEKLSISDEAFLDTMERVHLGYIWEGAVQNSGMAPERIHIDGIYPENDADVIAVGGSGFGIAGIIAGMYRGYIERSEGVARLRKIVDFLQKADTFHGAFPHWLEDTSGHVKPFGTKDNGGDIVETAYLIEGLLCARQYLDKENIFERELADDIDKIWQNVEWDWYQRGTTDKLYWHWSPNYGWEMNFAIEGYNECLIAYVLGASSPTHPINPEAYHKCWARGGNIVSDKEQYGLPLVLRYNGAEDYTGPLFWSHYSYIGLCPKGLKDKYADYWELVSNHAKIHYRYCIKNPLGHYGYGANCWGLTASYSLEGYAAHMPYINDFGVITPTAALSSFPYTPKESMVAMKHFYFDLKDLIYGKYGFYDAFCQEKDWYPKRYLAIDQCTISPMIENYRSGLLWKLFMSCPEVQDGLSKLGFTIETNI